MFEDTVTCPECQGEGETAGDDVVMCGVCLGTGEIPAPPTLDRDLLNY